MSVKIYCDMDGVLTDFEKKFRDFYHLDPRQITDAIFWPLVQYIPNFWESLEWMPGGKEIWDIIKPHNPTILTAPARVDHRAKPGKTKWVTRELGDIPIIFSRGKDKKNVCAGQDYILIDDTQSIIKDWSKAGGVGILNKDPAETVKRLQELLP